MDFDVIIPARYDSSRLPGKPLVDLCGKPLIQRVYECALQSSATNVTVATDDDRVRAAVEGFGGSVCLTLPSHPSGTDRIAETIEQLGVAPERIVVNLQGDEPRMPGGLIDQVATALERCESASIGTACHAIDNATDLFDPDVVKVVCDREGYAMYFSRAPVPWLRRSDNDTSRDKKSAPAAFRHIGLYSYRAQYVLDFARRPPCELETIERLEQLRALWYGERIIVCQANEVPGSGVDTAADLQRAREYFSEGY